MPTYVFAAARPELEPLEMSDRFRTDVAYFMTPPGKHGVPKLPEGEYWIRRDDAQLWYDDGVVEVVSPLDSEHHTEFEVNEEQEEFLKWLLDNEVEHVRVSRTR